MRSSCRVLILLAIATVSVAPVATAKSCRPSPASTLAADLLSALSPTVQAERQSAVEATLASCPGAMEQFLSSLMSWDFLLAQQAAPNLLAGASGPSGVIVFSERSLNMCSMSSGMGIAMGGTVYQVRERGHVSPLLLDLDRDGVPGVNGGHWEPHTGIDLGGPHAAFDIDGDGFRDIVEWLGSGDGLLVAPESPSDIVVTALGPLWAGPRPLDGRDLFGSAGGYRDGFEKLLQRCDSNHDGVVAGSELDGLYVWTDTDGDGVADPGELRGASDLGIESLSPPPPGGCVGSYQKTDLNHADLWDWWPSYFTANKVSPGTLPPASVPLKVVPLADHSGLGPVLSPDSDGRIAAPALALAGMDLESARLIAVARDDGWTVLQDRSSDSAEIAAGRTRRLWILGPAAVSGGAVTPRIVPLPVADVLQFVFVNPNRALISADAGSRLLRVDLPTGHLEELVVPNTSSGSFRFSFFEEHNHGQAFFSCSLLDPAGNAGPEVLARVDDSTDPPTLVADLDIDNARASASGLGAIVAELPDSPGRQFFVTHEEGVATLVKTESGVASVVADQIAPRGLAASGDGVLYFRWAHPGDSEVEICVYDAQSGITARLGRGDYGYPYLVADGRLAVVANVDWPESAMHVYAAVVKDTTTFREVLSCGIGAVRVADDGSALACLAPEGLYLTSRVAAAVTEFPVKAMLSLGAYPNPFRTSASLRFTLPETRHVHVDVLSIDGRHIARLVDGQCPAGASEIVWSGEDAHHHPLPAGVYLVRVDDGLRSLERKVSLLR